LEAAFKKGGTKYEIKVYEADHAFMNRDGHRYDKDRAKEAFEYTVAYFKEHLN